MDLIKLNYGPYEANGILKHRPQRLHGLISSLTSQGYGVELIPSEHLNRFTVDIRGVTVFRCDIRNLPFNVIADNDVVCQRALAVIEEALHRISKETNIPKFASVKEGMRYIELRKKLETTDFLTTSGVKLMYEIQDQYKKISEKDVKDEPELEPGSERGPEPVPAEKSDTSNSRNLSTRFSKALEGEEVETSGFTPITVPDAYVSKSTTYDQSTSAPSDFAEMEDPIYFTEPTQDDDTFFNNEESAVFSVENLVSDHEQNIDMIKIQFVENK